MIGVSQPPGITAATANATYATGRVSPTDPAATLPHGTEYVWFKTDGAGHLLDILTGVTA